MMHQNDRGEQHIIYIMLNSNRQSVNNFTFLMLQQQSPPPPYHIHPLPTFLA
jgi:hypothetical protein